MIKTSIARIMYGTSIVYAFRLVANHIDSIICAIFNLIPGGSSVSSVAVSTHGSSG